MEKFLPKLIFSAKQDIVTWSGDIYEVIDTDDHYVYVMERPEVCKDLFDVIHDWDNLGRPQTEREARRYLAQILQASINCEETGVLHRDIKPENILVDMCTDEAKLINFALASEVQQNLSQDSEVRILLVCLVCDICK